MSNEQTPFPPPTSPTTTRADDAPTSALAGTPDTRSAELIDKLVRGAHQSIDRLAESAAPRLGRLEQSMTGAAEALQARGEHLRETGDEWAESLRTSVREHPLAAIGVAVAVGMLIARLTAR